MTTHIAYCDVGVFGQPAVGATGNEPGETITASGSNQVTTIVTTGKVGFARVASTDAVYVAFGTSPNATVATGRFMIPAGGVDYFAVQPGWKAAVVQVS